MNSENNTDNYDLKPVWLAILDVYKVFSALCDRNNLRYSLAWGTALGAIRHKGFIPWDDDFDVMMPRPDYDRFLSIAEKELPKYFKLVDLNNTKEYHWYFSKIQFTDEKTIDKLMEQSGLSLPQGIYIDVFPVDGYNPNKVFRFKRALKHFFLYGYWHLVSGAPYNTLKSIAGNLVGIIAYPFFPKMKTQREITLYAVEDCKKTDINVSDWCGLFPDEHRFGFMGSFVIPKRCIEELTMVDFQGITAPMPVDYDTYLRCCYGDYMQLPPVEKRRLTHGEQEVAPWRLGPTGI